MGAAESCAEARGLQVLEVVQEMSLTWQGSEYAAELQLVNGNHSTPSKSL